MGGSRPNNNPKTRTTSTEWLSPQIAFPKDKECAGSHADGSCVPGLEVAHVISIPSPLARTHHTA